MNNLSVNEIKFISEQDGIIEREFKQKIAEFLNKKNDLVRAYLAQVRYKNNSDEFVVALCLKANNKDIQHIVDSVSDIFQNMFGHDEHLDIVVLEDQQEYLLRQVCCPFYVSEQYQMQVPDFYLISSEGYDLKDPIECYKRKKLKGMHPDGYMLCDIIPSLDASKYAVEGGKICQLVFAARHENYSLFPIAVWPAYVHIAVPLKYNSATSFELAESDIKLIAWGELYKEYSDVK